MNGEFEIFAGIKSSILAGGAYGLGAIGLSLIYKYLKFPDFTTIASMIIGSVATIFISNHTNLATGIFCSILLSGFLGLITGVQVAYAKIPGILAGIITGTGATTLAFVLTTNSSGEEVSLVSFDPRFNSVLNYLIPNTFSWWGLGELIILTIIIAFLVSRFFKTRYGVYTLALLGTDHYLKYRHRHKEFTQILLLILGNAIIGFAGSVFAIHEHTAYSQSHQDFLIVAIGGYSLGNFLLQLFSSKSMKGLLEKEKKPTASWFVQVAQILTANLHLNEEEPKKIFITLIFYSISATIINVIFKSVETVGDVGNYNFVFKALILLGILLLSNWYNTMAKSISNH